MQTMQTIVLYQNQCVRSTNQNVSKRPSFLSLIYLYKRCVLSILEISHTNQIALVFIYPDATDKLDSGLNISRQYFGKNNFFGFELFYPFFQISSLSYSKIDSMKKNQILPSSRFNFGINPTLHKWGSHNDHYYEAFLLWSLPD